MGLSQLLTAHVQTFCLVFFRVASLFMIAPIFGNRSVGPRIKIAIAFFITVALVPVVTQGRPPALRPWSALPLLVLQESSVGFMIGLVASLIFAATHLSGEMLGRHMGFGLAKVIDPNIGGQASVVAQFENLVALMLFLAVSGHHLLVLALGKSFEIVPLGGVRYDAVIPMDLVRVVGRIFPLAIQITAPAFVILILTTVVIGLVARCVPQMNVLIVGLPLKIGVGLIGLAACVPMFSYIFDKMLRATNADIYALLDGMH